MSEIYRRYNPSGQTGNRQQNLHTTPPGNQQPPRQATHQNDHQSSNQKPATPKTTPEKVISPKPPSLPHPEKKEISKPSTSPPPRQATHQTSPPKNPVGFIQNLIPKALYNHDSKKVLGIFSTEDLLLVALIFLFLENSNEEDNSLMILALAYVLLSEYIDFGEFSF